jgi:uncharacterized membrane protein YeaQ/YmgE (transglycosylase-associated protein family)
MLRGDKRNVARDARVAPGSRTLERVTCHELVTVDLHRYGTVTPGPVAPPMLLGPRIAFHRGMTVQTILLWLVIGLIAGWLASAVVGGGYGIIGDIVVGVIGAFVGGFVFRKLGIGPVFSGLAGTIFVAFIGAVILLVILRLIHRRRIDD